MPRGGAHNARAQHRRARVAGLGASRRRPWGPAAEGGWVPGRNTHARRRAPVVQRLLSEHIPGDADPHGRGQLWPNFVQSNWVRAATEDERFDEGFKKARDQQRQQHLPAWAPRGGAQGPSCRGRRQARAGRARLTRRPAAARVGKSGLPTPAPCGRRRRQAGFAYDQARQE